ncbi:MAG TPA: FAD-binding oxidoreductase [bacterium]|nr:FAD-binding oxidoreductase [bacterium]
MAINPQIFKELEAETPPILLGDERIESYCEDTMYRGSPDAVLLPRKDEDILAAIEFCSSYKIPLTICGSQTSMTGASVPDEGLLLSTEKLEGIEDIVDIGGQPHVVVKPGTVVSQLQAELAKKNLFYPIGPTSKDQCRIGANIATNATGEDSYKYGTVRQYVQSLELITPDCKSVFYSREPGEAASGKRNTAGYFTGWENPIDLIIGSEGTLGFISRATIRLIPGVPSFFSALIPFESNMEALSFAVNLTLNEKDKKPRTLELIDSGALKMMKTSRSFPSIPNEIAAYLYIKQEYDSEKELGRWAQIWQERIQKACGCDLEKHSMVALTQNDQEIFRLWRHRIPEAANELGRLYWKDGGGKVGSDWWVPIDKLIEMMEFFYAAADRSGLPHMGYAHIGAGHPHTNLLGRTPTEKNLARDILSACCKKAVELGGGVAGEHGLGKIHTDLLSIQHSKSTIELMKHWKNQYDPDWIFGRGNIFGTTSV